MHINTIEKKSCIVLRLPFADRQSVKQRPNKGELPVNVARLEQRTPSLQDAIEDEIMERLSHAIDEYEIWTKSAHESAVKAQTLIKSLYAYRTGSDQRGSVSL